MPMIGISLLAWDERIHSLYIQRKPGTKGMAHSQGHKALGSIPCTPKRRGEREKERKREGKKEKSDCQSGIFGMIPQRLPSWWRTLASSVRNNDQKKSQFKCCLEKKIAFHIYELWSEIKSISTEGMYSVAHAIQNSHPDDLGNSNSQVPGVLPGHCGLE